MSFVHNVLIEPLLYRALFELIFINFFFDNLLANIFAVLREVVLSHLVFHAFQLFNVAELLKLMIHLFRYVGEDVKYHSDDNVEDNPLYKNVEDHEEDAGPDLSSTRTNHHIRHGRPVVDDHEREQGHKTCAKVVEVD